MYDRKDFQWRHSPSRRSSSGVLLVYIDERELHPNRDKKQMMLAALKAHYLPLAYLAKGHSREEVERVGWDSVLALLDQVDFLCSVLGLERKLLGHHEAALFKEVRVPQSSVGLVESSQKPESRHSSGESKAPKKPEPLNNAGLSNFRFSYSHHKPGSRAIDSQTQ